MSEEDPYEIKLEDKVRELTAHLGLAVTMINTLCKAKGVDTEGTCLSVEMGGHSAKIPLSTMIAKWTEMAEA